MKPEITARISGRRGLSLLRVEKERMNGEHGFCTKVLQMMEDKGRVLQTLSIGIDAMILVIQSELTKEQQRDIVRTIYRVCEAEQVEFEDSLAMILVEFGTQEKTEAMVRIYKVLSEIRIREWQVAQNSGRITVFIWVNEKDYEQGIERVYETFLQ